MIADDTTFFNVLHVLRIKGAASAGDLARSAAPADPAPAVARLEDDGFVARRATGDGEWFALTPAGRERHAAALNALLDDAAVATLGPVYDGVFLPLNKRFKRLCSDWQTAGADHFELLDDALSVHERITLFLTEAASLAPHYRAYAERFDAIIAAVEEGDVGVYVAPVGESYHNVWFELHEDLLVSLRRSRAEEEARSEAT